MNWKRSGGGLLLDRPVPPGIDDLAALERRHWQERMLQARREGLVAADNITIKDSGGTDRVIAADDISSVFYQRMKNVWGADGTANDVSEAKPLPVQNLFPGDSYALDIPSQVHVASANTVHFDLFNADAALIVRVLSIRQIPDIVTAVTGVAFAWKLARTTSVGTGGGSLTPWLPNTAQTALDADITARSKPSGGAAEGTILRNYSIHSEETNTGTLQIAAMGGYELVPPHLVGGEGIRLGQNQGLRCVQITNSNAGNTGWLISFTME